MGELTMPIPRGDGGDPNKDKRFKVMPKPELQEGWREERVETENGQPLKHRIFNDKENAVYTEDRWYQQNQEPSCETMGGHRQNFLTYDDQSRVLEEIGQTLSTTPDHPKHEQQWRTNYEHSEDGSSTETGEIETGKDAGHKWRKTKEVQRFNGGRKIVTERTEILEQGKNPEKPEPGPVSKVVKYFENRQWLGEKATDKEGKEHINLAPGVEKLPDWNN